MGVMVTLATLKLLQWYQLPTLSQYHHRSDRALHAHDRPPVPRLGKTHPHHRPPGTEPHPDATSLSRLEGGDMGWSCPAEAQEVGCVYVEPSLEGLHQYIIYIMIELSKGQL